MSKGRRIDDDELRSVGARLMNRLNHLLLAVALQTGQARARSLGFGLQTMVDLIQRF